MTQCFLELDLGPAASGRLIWATIRTSVFADGVPALAVQSDISTITMDVFTSAGVQVGSQVPLTVASVILNTTVQVFGKDRNFRYVIPAASFPAADSLGYTCSFVITPASGEVIRFVVRVPTFKTW